MIVNGKNVYGIIYKITNKITGQSYIGQTKNKRGFKGRYYMTGTSNEERLLHYLRRMKELGDYYNQHLLNSIEKYGVENFEVTEILDTANSKEELNKKEIYYIKKYNSYNTGFNKTPGGECGSCFEQPKGIDNPLSVQVVQLTLDGEYVKEWGSLADIKRAGLNIPNIEQTCLGINSQSYGYLWVFKKDYDPYKKYCWIRSNNYKPIVLLDNEGKIIKEFPSIVDACKEMNLDRTTVRSSCQGRWFKPKYNFKYKKDYEYIEEQRLNERTMNNNSLM